MVFCNSPPWTIPFREASHHTAFSLDALFRVRKNPRCPIPSFPSTQTRPKNPHPLEPAPFATWRRVEGCLGTAPTRRRTPSRAPNAEPCAAEALQSLSLPFAATALTLLPGAGLGRDGTTAVGAVSGPMVDSMLEFMGDPSRLVIRLLLKGLDWWAGDGGNCSGPCSGSLFDCAMGPTYDGLGTFLQRCMDRSGCMRMSP